MEYIKTGPPGNLRETLNSNDVEKIIEASDYIGKNKDTNLVAYLLKNSLDPRISHDIHPFRYAL